MSGIFPLCFHPISDLFERERVRRTGQADALSPPVGGEAIVLTIFWASFPVLVIARMDTVIWFMLSLALAKI